MLTSKEAYCPNCKQTHEFKGSMELTRPWRCVTSNTRFSTGELNEAFLNLHKDTVHITDVMKNKAVASSGGLKHDQDKVRMELLPIEPLEEIAKVLTFGAKKYADENWRKGISYKRLIGAAFRHLSAFCKGEDKDPESDLPHLAHLGCCVLFLIQMTLKRPDLDDRYKAEIK